MAWTPTWLTCEICEMSTIMFWHIWRPAYPGGDPRPLPPGRLLLPRRGHHHRHRRAGGDSRHAHRARQTRPAPGVANIHLRQDGGEFRVTMSRCHETWRMTVAAAGWRPRVVVCHVRPADVAASEWRLPPGEGPAGLRPSRPEAGQGQAGQEAQTEKVFGRNRFPKSVGTLSGILTLDWMCLICLIVRRSSGDIRWPGGRREPGPSWPRGSRTSTCQLDWLTPFLQDNSTSLW